MRCESKFVAFTTKYFCRQKQYNFIFEINNHRTQYFFHLLFVFVYYVRFVV